MDAAPPTQTGNDEAPEQWDILTTIAKIEELDDAMEEIVEHTIEEMGRMVGFTPDGHEMIEHPIGEAVMVVQKMLRMCHAKYGMEIIEAGRSMDAGNIPDLQPKEK